IAISALNDPDGVRAPYRAVEGRAMEKPVDPGIQLTILHHDDHLIFPGYDAMIGKGCVGQDEEEERKPWAAGNLQLQADPDACGRNVVRLGLYKKHEKLLFVVGTIWCAALILIPCLRSTISPFISLENVIAHYHHEVDNLGPVGGATGDVIGSIMVQIIDGCPAGSAWNYW
ncbi:MAG: hypothetical protein LQ343_007899, partial [Gyalolechia ehrenbergii]